MKLSRCRGKAIASLAISESLPYHEWHHVGDAGPERPGQPVDLVDAAVDVEDGVVGPVGRGGLGAARITQGVRPRIRAPTLREDDAVHRGRPPIPRVLLRLY